jgi:hypothetical protein
METVNEPPTGVPPSPPRLPDQYDDTPHYRKRVGCDRRPITERDARKTIQSGDVGPNPVDRPHSWRFTRTVDGMRIGAVVGEDKHRPTLVKITAYVDVTDARVAWSSNRWSNDDVMVAAMLQRLVGEHVPHLPPVRIDVTDPVLYHGHRLIWKAGFHDAYCIRCDRSSNRKDEWVDMACR